MEGDSGAKIAIRGKGSVKEGKGRSDAAHSSNQEEDLHCLIMADTEDKVNKAKQLIHNVIETVGVPYPVPSTSCSSSNILRLLRFPKARTSSSATNSESSPLSTERSETTRTRRARTAVRLVTASMIALSARTTPRASFAVSVATPGTWRVIVPTDRRVQAGATMPSVSALPARSAEEMKSTVKWRYVADLSPTTSKY